MSVSLNRKKHPLSNPSSQVNYLENDEAEFPTFKKILNSAGQSNLEAQAIDVFQLNLGKMCNQTCRHCHVDAGPDRKEIMTREIMKACLKALDSTGAETVDLTGGAPEMNPDFRWLVNELSARKKHIIVRCNLTIINANRKYVDLPQFYREHRVHVVSSLPHFTAGRTDAQRGSGVFERSIQALRALNKEGFGKEKSHLQLDLVYNPSGAFLPGSQQSLEKEFKRKLKSGYGIDFHQLLCITNLPISRFLEYLDRSGNYEHYMNMLIQAFNPTTIDQLMCRNTLSVGWDGMLYDCDFNQMLDLPVSDNRGMHITAFDKDKLRKRAIRTGRHCFGCTAGSGSSCGGSLT